jgi:hypothetical protein
MLIKKRIPSNGILYRGGAISKKPKALTQIINSTSYLNTTRGKYDEIYFLAEETIGVGFTIMTAFAVAVDTFAANEEVIVPKPRATIRAADRILSADFDIFDPL